VSPLRTLAAALALTALALNAALPGTASAAPPADSPACGKARPGHARCLSVVHHGRAQIKAATAELPDGLNPQLLDLAYKLPADAGTGQTIAIVDAYDHPNAEADLAAYRETFGLPACTTANGCFAKLDQRGEPGPYPAADPGWALEISLDLDAVSAACPNCGIILVEADSSSLENLAAAVDTAAGLNPVAISNSYGADEFNGMDAYAPHYAHPGTTVVVSSGDGGFGPAQYPAVLPTVLAVGGTTLTAEANARGWSESAWSGAGSGCSAYVAKPSWQHDPNCHMRTTADVSAVADPATGLAVYDSVPINGHAGWHVVGGTSLAAPLIAAVVGLAGDGHRITPGTVYANASSLFDPVGGSNGRNGYDCGGDYLCTGLPGYDGPTGLGTPDGVAAFQAPTATP
jgi:subtilase family serine protease